MPERQPRKAGLSPSPVPLALLIVLATLVVLAAVYLFTIGMTAPVPTQTVAQQGGIVAATSEPNLTGAPIIETMVVRTPTDRPTRPLPATPTDYVARPTAQFTTPIPIDQWIIHDDKQARFSIMYPPDWYLTTTPSEDRVFGSTTQLFSYDPNDPTLESKSHPPPPNFTKLEIVVVDDLKATGEVFLPNQTIEEWVRTSRVIDESVQDQMRLLSEGSTSVGGVPAYYQVIEYATRGTAKTTYVYHDGRLIFIVHGFEEEDSFNDLMLRGIMSTIKFK